MHWYFDVLKKYLVFNGRARRMEYWMFFLFNLIISIALGVVDGMLGTINMQYGIGMLGLVYALAVLLPSLAVTIRRLHDTDRSGWWVLIVFVPLIGPIVLLVFMVLGSTPGQNRFGANPL